MSVRMKAILILVAITTFITVTAMGMCFVLINNSLMQAMESDIVVMARIAERLVSGEINLLKAKASITAHVLTLAPKGEWARIMREQAESSGDFIGLAVFDRDGIVDAYGNPAMPVELKDSEYVQRAFLGETVISTIRKTPDGELVFHVCVPMGGRVLSATIPGMFFSDLLAPFKIWDTGAVYILDSDGTVLAHERRFLVREQYNAIRAVQTDPTLRSTAEYSRRMIRGGEGTGRHVMFGVERLAAYTSIREANVNWTLGVSTPLPETPAAHVDRLLLITTMVFLGMGTVAAAIASGSIAKPFRIISEQNERLAALRETAQRASDAKSHFLANMSHEMRTPLNAIVGFSELMILSPAGEETVRDNLRKIHAAGMTLLGLVNDILDISKIESGKLELIPEEYELASLINDTVTLNFVRVAGKSVKFSLVIDENLPSRLVGDKLKIKQICNNLLSNAFKYTPKGEVELGVSGERESENVWLTIRVRDTGIGIRPKDMTRLFSEYNQVDAKSNRGIEGTGLGLSITRRLAEMMDGAIAVESEYGKGSVFTVRLRQRFVTDQLIGAEVVENLKNFRGLVRQGARNGNMAISRLSYASVLVVDDVPANLDITRGMLKPYGMKVDCVGSGREAIELVREAKTRYSAIFMDHMMPEMDGMEAVRIIREEIGTEYAKSVPIVALTANAVAGNERMFLEHGFQAFLPKPVDMSRLDAILERWVRDRAEAEYMERTKTAPGKETGPGPSAAVAEWRIEGFDLEKALARFGGDEEALLHSLRSYAANTPPLMERVREPDANKREEYTIVVHGVKSSSYAVGAMALGEKAEELERAARSGDFEFVAANNGAFLEATGRLLADLSSFLQVLQREEEKPVKDEPDRGTLERLRKACAAYDMDGVDAAMAELEHFTYARGSELVVWLRESVDEMEFQRILNKLSAD
jgi:signal transduction histidine kinase/CheY-like chemotaxis protein/HPt (histidine-containing phosphotransfer) domain-containing protein